MGNETQLPRVEILGPLRGLAALAVAWSHIGANPAIVKTEWLRASGAYGWLGVEVFFVISGFVIPYSMYCGGYQLKRHFGRFFVKRLARLEPPYLVSIVLVILLAYLSVLRPGFEGSKPQFGAAQVLLHVGYLNTFFGYPWLNVVYWTLGIEFQFYIFVAIVYPLLTARLRFVRAVVLSGMAGAPFLSPTPMLVFHYLGLFTLGILAFQYYAGLLPGKAFLAAAAVVALLTVLSQGLLSGAAGIATAFVIAFVPMPRHPAMRSFMFLGEISYSLYLLHAPISGKVFSIGLWFSGGLAWELTVVIAAMGMSIMAAVIFNRLVERPSQRLSSRIRYS